MADPLASVADLAAHLQQDFDAHDAYSAEQALRAASDLIRGFTGQELDYTSSVPPADVQGVCLDVAARRMRNPQGDRSLTIGPYATTPEAVGLALTPGEKEVLRARFGGRAAAYSVDLA